jgi:hypothetical protein
MKKLSFENRVNFLRNKMSSKCERILTSKFSISLSLFMFPPNCILYKCSFRPSLNFCLRVFYVCVCIYVPQFLHHLTELFVSISSSVSCILLSHYNLLPKVYHHFVSEVFFLLIFLLYLYLYIFFSFHLTLFYVKFIFKSFSSLLWVYRTSSCLFALVFISVYLLTIIWVARNYFLSPFLSLCSCRCSYVFSFLSPIDFVSFSFILRPT